LEKQSMHGKTRQTGWLAGLCLVLGTAAPAVPAQPGSGGPDAVVVTVRATATVAGAHVNIADMATLEGGSAAVRQRIAGMDLADLPSADQPAVLLREQVYYRIRISDLDPGQYRVEGAAQVRVSRHRYQVPEDELIAVAKEQILQHLPGQPEDISIQPAQAVRGPQIPDAGRDEVRLSAEYRSPAMPLGRVRVDVAVSVRGERRYVVPVSLDVRLVQTVVLTSRRIPAGESLTPDNVYLDRRALDSLNGYLSAAELRLGRKTLRALGAGQIVLNTDVAAAQPDNPILVKAQTPVQMVVRLGSLEVVAHGEALQDGRAGQLVRVRNIDSGKVVVGKVVDRSVVEVAY
jgi:flagella basal body P-ring formation protein FlgA